MDFEKSGLAAPTFSLSTNTSAAMDNVPKARIFAFNGGLYNPVYNVRYQSFQSPRFRYAMP